MAIQTVIICDVCGKGKGETNHWFGYELSKSAGSRIQFVPMALIQEDDLPAWGHLCGLECLHKRLGQWAEKKVAA